MKSKHYIIFFILILLPGISGCAWQSQGLHVDRIDFIPENFINISVLMSTSQTYFKYIL